MRNHQILQERCIFQDLQIPGLLCNQEKFDLLCTNIYSNFEFLEFYKIIIPLLSQFKLIGRAVKTPHDELLHVSTSQDSTSPYKARTGFMISQLAKSKS